ncbi:MAG TPA: S8 family serine peptidase [Pirellulales bacterium]|nr:S8 family serine peptidase [Pirellulales bacterium]
MLRRALIRTFLFFGLIGAMVGQSGCSSKLPGRPAEPSVAATAERFAPDDWASLKAEKSGALTTGAAAPVAPAAGQPAYAPYNLEFDSAASCKALQVDGVHVLTRFDRFADILISPTDDNAFKKLSSAHGMRWFEIASGTVAPPPPPLAPAAETTRAVPEEIIRGGLNGLTGKGVIVAVLDSGVDFHHPDFISYDSAGRPTSRLLYFWDTLRNRRSDDKLGSAAPVTYPNGASIGTIYSRGELTADLRSSQPQITDCDTNGHGTACAGIAAGNGRASNGQFAGVAPDADIIAVRIGGADGTMASPYLIGAICDWLEKVAAQSPLVISCSFGGSFGGHDGFMVEERQLDARFPLDRPGRAICFSAGNDRTKHYHTGLTIAGSASPGKLDWTVPDACRIRIYVQTNNKNDLQMTPGAGTTLTASGTSLYALTQQVVLSATVPKGKGSLSIVSKAGRTYHADAYLANADGEFTDGDGKCEKLVVTPGSGGNVITVGSYNWNNLFEQAGKVISLADAEDKTKSPMTIGGLSGYSSPGFLRIGDAVKPEIVAPGQYFAAAAPLVLKSVDWARDTSGRYRAFNGTSAAAPYTAGIVALMMQKNPKITPGEIKNAFKTNATTDEYTGPVPNIDWGYGKLDADAVRRILVGKYAVWVYQNVNGQWIKQDGRTLNTDDPQKAADYAAEVNKVSGWKATSNAPAK